MKSLSLLAEKYQEVQFNDPAVMVEAHSPHQLLESLKEYNKTHDLKAVFNYIAESRKNGSVLVTESLIEKNAAAAATILAVEKILTYYIEGKDARFNREVLLALEAAPLTAKGLGFKRRTPPATGAAAPAATAPAATAPAAPAAGAPVTPVTPDDSKSQEQGLGKYTTPVTPGAPQKTGAWAGLKNIVGKGLEYLGKAAGKFAGGAASQKTAGAVEDAPYGDHITDKDISTLSAKPVVISTNTLTATYGVSPDDLAKLKDGTVGGINLNQQNTDKYAEIKYGKNGLYTIRYLSAVPEDPAAAAAAAAAAVKKTPAKKKPVKKKAPAADALRAPAAAAAPAAAPAAAGAPAATVNPGTVTSGYVPFSSLANKVLKEFYITNKALPLETNSKK